MFTPSPASIIPFHAVLAPGASQLLHDASQRAAAPQCNRASSHLANAIRERSYLIPETTLTELGISCIIAALAVSSLNAATECGSMEGIPADLPTDITTMAARCLLPLIYAELACWRAQREQASRTREMYLSLRQCSTE